MIVEAFLFLYLFVRVGLCGRGEYDSAGKYVILWDTEDAGGAGNPEGRGREVSNFFLSL